MGEGESQPNPCPSLKLLTLEMKPGEQDLISLKSNNLHKPSPEF